MVVLDWELFVRNSGNPKKDSVVQAYTNYFSGLTYLATNPPRGEEPVSRAWADLLLDLGRIAKVLFVVVSWWFLMVALRVRTTLFWFLCYDLFVMWVCVCCSRGSGLVSG